MVKRTVLLGLMLLVTPVCLAGDIGGFWKHAEEPGWIEISVETGIGTVVRNDVYPERVGRQLLKELEADGARDNLWRGQVYAERFGEYRDAKVTLEAPDRLSITVKVGFMSRSIEWVRVEEVPATDAGD